MNEKTKKELELETHFCIFCKKKFRSLKRYGFAMCSNCGMEYEKYCAKKILCRKIVG